MKRNVFLGTLIGYLCFPAIVSAFLFACTLSPTLESFFGTDNVIEAQGQTIATAGSPVGSSETTGKSASEAASATQVDLHSNPSATHADEPFHQITYVAPEGILWTKWRPIAKAISAELETNLQCRAQPDKCPAGAATKFNDIVNYALKYDGRVRLGMVNRTVNLSIKYTTDRQQYGVDDFWATPFQTLETGKGDCEDYAITKHAVLRATGWNASDLRIVVLYDSLLRDYHAVSAARDHDSWWILDNRTMAILEDVNLAHYRPLFVVDDASVRQLTPPAPPGGFTITSVLATSAGEPTIRVSCGDGSLANLVRSAVTDWLRPLGRTGLAGGP